MSENKQELKLNMITQNPSSSDLLPIANNFNDKNIIINDTYQRGYVWNDNRIKQELIISVIKHLPIGVITFWETSPLENKIEILDGQQRLQTICDFIFPKKSKPAKLSKKSIANINSFYQNQNSDIKIPELDENKYYSYKDLPDYYKRRINVYKLNINTITGPMKGNKLDENELRNYFSSIQNQERLRAGEIIKSIQSNVITYVFNKEILENITNNLKFNNKRNDLIKHLSMLFCLENNKLRMNVKDSEILKKIELFSIENNKIEIEEFQKKAYVILKENSQNINNQDKKIFSALALKLYLLSNFYIKNDKYLKETLEFKRNFINYLISKIKLHNSPNPEKKEKEIKESHKKYILKLWQLSKNSHTKEYIQNTLNKDFIELYHLYKKDII